MADKTPQGQWQQSGQEERDRDEPQSPAPPAPAPSRAGSRGAWGFLGRGVSWSSRQPVGNTFCTPEAMVPSRCGSGLAPRSQGRQRPCPQASPRIPTTVLTLHSFGKYTFEDLLCI